MTKKIISFMNMKGGVGKTTLCVNIANTLATHFDKKVLLIDMDPQFNASQYALRVIYGKEHTNVYDQHKKEGKTIFSIYKKIDNNQKEKEDIQKSIFHTKSINDGHLRKNYSINLKENFDIILGDIDLIELQITQKSGIEQVLEKYIELNEFKENYDYIFIDSPPTYSFFFISSYRSCDTYILPVKPDYLSANGITLLGRAEDAIVETLGKKVNPLGIIYTLIDPRNSLHIPVQESIKKNIGSENIFKHEMRYLKKIPEGLDKQKFMLDIEDQDIAKDIRLITEEFLTRINK